jgi:hypothetical protein
LIERQYIVSGCLQQDRMSMPATATASDAPDELVPDPQVCPLQRDHDLEGKVTRRFPPPWHVDKMPGGYFVRDANGQALVYVYSRASEAEALQAKVLTADEAGPIAINVARLPRLLRREE